jgi:hypothetical protein
MRGKLFICQSAGSDAGFEHALLQVLEQAFPPETLLMDFASVPDGYRIAGALPSQAGECDALVVVLGSGWSAANGQDGARLIDDPSDPVRVAIQSAVAQGVPIVPALLPGTEMPTAEALPENVRAALDRPAIRLTAQRFKVEALEMVADLRSLLAPMPAPLAADPKLAPDREALSIIERLPGSEGAVAGSPPLAPAASPADEVGVDDDPTPASDSVPEVETLIAGRTEPPPLPEPDAGSVQAASDPFEPPNMPAVLRPAGASSTRPPPLPSGSISGFRASIYLRTRDRVRWSWEAALPKWRYWAALAMIITATVGVVAYQVRLDPPSSGEVTRTTARRSTPTVAVGQPRQPESDRSSEPSRAETQKATGSPLDSPTAPLKAPWWDDPVAREELDRLFDTLTPPAPQSNSEL